MNLTDPFSEVVKTVYGLIKDSEDETNTAQDVDEKFKNEFNQHNYEPMQDKLEHLLFKAKEKDDNKDVVKSIKSREEGNKFFQEGKFLDCLKCYNNSILLAPCNNNFEELNNYVEFSMSLANRAAVLGKFKMHRNVAEDLEVAIKSGYPKHLMYKAYQRLGVAYEGLGDQNKAISAYEKLVNSFDDSDIPIDKLKKMKNDARFSLNSFKQGLSTKHCPTDQLSLSSKHEDNSNFSSKLAIRKTERKGRFAVAGEKIEAGEVVSQEKAVVSFLNPSKRMTHCLHCCQEVLDHLIFPRW